MLAHPMYTILPPLPPESQENTRIYSAMGRLLESKALPGASPGRW